MRDAPVNLMVLSDSTGNLPRQMLATVLTQYPADSITVRFECFVRTERQLHELQEKAARENALVCHAMASGALRKKVRERCSLHQLRCLDLTGALADFLQKAIQSTACTFNASHRIDARITSEFPDSRQLPRGSGRGCFQNLERS